MVSFRHALHGPPGHLGSEPVKVKHYDVIDRAVEEGAGYGVHRAFKHNDAPTPSQLVEAVRQSVMDSICEYYKFHEDEA